MTTTCACQIKTIPTCGTCRHHSSRDACCELTGETRRRSDAACMEWSDGRVTERSSDGGEQHKRGGNGA